MKLHCPEHQAMALHVERTEMRTIESDCLRDVMIQDPHGLWGILVTFQDLTLQLEPSSEYLLLFTLINCRSVESLG